MSMRPRTQVAVTLVLLLASGLGCGFANELLRGQPSPEQPPPTVTGAPTEALTSTPTPTPTPSLSFPGGTATLENPAGGFDLRYPADWVAEAEEGIAIVAESQEALEDADPTQNAVLFIMSGTPEELPAQWGAEPTAEGLVAAFLEDAEQDETVEVGEIETRPFARQEGAGAPIRGTEDDEPIEAYVAAYADDEVAAVLVAVGPADGWESLWPTFESIFAGLVFYAPEGTAPPATVDRGDLRKGSAATATLAPNGTDVWVYESPGSELLVVDVVAQTDWDPYLEVFDQAGDSIDYDDDGGADLNPRLCLSLPASGRYEFHVTAFSGSGEYEIRVTGEEALDGGSLTYGETVEGDLEEGESELWTFEGAEGDAITISMIGYGELEDTYLELYGPGWAQEAEDDDSGQDYFALIEAYRLAEDGTYRIVARAWGSDTGRYELTLERMP